jgi:putative hydrolase of HD superfamily
MATIGLRPPLFLLTPACLWQFAAELQPVPSIDLMHLASILLFLTPSAELSYSFSLSDKKSLPHRRMASSAPNNSNDQRAITPTKTSASAASLEFARLIGKLKTTPRTGWVRRGVPRYESVADHSWRVAALSLLLAGRKDVDLNKCLPMALIHDIAESIVGDIPPEDNVSKEDKQRMEKEAVAKIAGILREATTGSDDPALAEKILLDLFHEYEDRVSKEAIVVKDLDLLDMIIQADEYERSFDVDLSEFFESTPVSGFRDPSLAKVAEEIHHQRQQRIEASEKDQKKQESTLSKNDEAFIAEHSKASSMSADSIEKVVEALRQWESRG